MPDEKNKSISQTILQELKKSGINFIVTFIPRAYVNIKTTYSFESMIEKFQNQLKDVNKTLERINNENKNLKDEVLKLNNENRNLKDEIKKLNDKVQTFTEKNKLK